VPVSQPKKDDYVVVVTEITGKKPVVAATSSAALNEATGIEGNPTNESYPILPAGQYYWKGSEYGYAPPPTIDEAQKNVHGVTPDVESFDYGVEKHPMELKTPLYDFKPCSPDRVLTVKVNSVDPDATGAHPLLPPRYGCTTDKELSREKASPSITWGNYSSAEIQEFSLQMISMGDDTCSGYPADGYNRIHWHIVGMKPPAGSDSMTLDEAASKDKRMLFGGLEQPNQWLEEYYGGPCPAAGVTECFRFKVLAHLHDGETCYCGHEDVVFTRPIAPEEPPAPAPVIYNEPVLAPVGAKN